MDVLIANLHVPHSGHTEDEIIQFWHDFQQAVPPHLRDMGDFNARVDSTTSSAIGSLGEEDEKVAGGLLHEFLQRAGLFLPATFEGVHSGLRTYAHMDSPQWCYGSSRLPCHSSQVGHFRLAHVH